MLIKAGYKVAASCGLKDWKEKGKALVGKKPAGDEKK
jgi:hypothetical protein